MDSRRIWTICRKELRETFRDRRTIVALFLLPPLLYPLLALLSLKLTESRHEEYESLPSRIALEGEEIPELRAFLAGTPGLALASAAPESSPMTGAPGPASALPADPGGSALGRGEAEVELWVLPGGAAAFASGGTARLELRFDAASDRSLFGRDRVERALAELAHRVEEDRLLAEGFSVELSTPLRIEPLDVAPPEKVGGSLLARMVPALLILLMMVGALYPAIDLTVGEKERGTLEVLLAAPVKPIEVVAGKFLAVATMAMASGLVNVGSMAFTAGTILAQLQAAGKDVSLSLGLGSVVALLASLALVALLFAALMMAVAAPARTLKEAQASVMPVYLACIVPAMLANVGGFELSYGIALVPLMGMTLLVRALFLGDVPWGPAAVALVAAAGHAAFALWLAARSFTRERALFGAPRSEDARTPDRAPIRAPAAPRPAGAAPPPLRSDDPAASRLAATWSAPGATMPGGDPSPGPGGPVAAGGSGGAGTSALPPRSALNLVEALILVLGIVVLMLTVGGLLQLTLGTLGFAISEWVLLPVPVILALRLLHVDFVPALSLRVPSARAVAGAALVGATAWYPAMLAAMALAPLVRPDPEALKALEEIVRAPEQPWVTLAVFAISPAVCEELVFRGALLSAFRTRMAAPLAVLLAAVLFAAFHQPAFRMAPTFVLGLVFGYAVWRSGSLATAAIAHLLNNALVVLASTYGDMPASPDLAAAFSEPPVPWPIGLGIIGLLGLGLWTLWGSGGTGVHATPEPGS